MVRNIRDQCGLVAQRMEKSSFVTIKPSVRVFKPFRNKVSTTGTWMFGCRPDARKRNSPLASLRVLEAWAVIASLVFSRDTRDAGGQSCWPASTSESAAIRPVRARPQLLQATHAPTAILKQTSTSVSPVSLVFPERGVWCSCTCKPSTGNAAQAPRPT